ANGVVIIKTKRGTEGDMQVDFSVSGGVQNAINTPNLVNGPQIEMLMNEAAVNNGKPAPYDHPENAPTTNWPGLVFGTGSLQNYKLSVNGGNKRVKYSVSGGHYMNTGSVRPFKYRRTSGQLDLDMDVS